MTLPYGPLRIDVTLTADGYLWRVGYKDATLVRATVLEADPEVALTRARVWCAAFRAALCGVVS